MTFGKRDKWHGGHEGAGNLGACLLVELSLDCGERPGEAVRSERAGSGRALADVGVRGQPVEPFDDEMEEPAPPFSTPGVNVRWDIPLGTRV